MWSSSGSGLLARANLNCHPHILGGDLKKCGLITPWSHNGSGLYSFIPDVSRCSPRPLFYLFMYPSSFASLSIISLVNMLVLEVLLHMSRVSIAYWLFFIGGTERHVPTAILQIWRHLLITHLTIYSTFSFSYSVLQNSLCCRRSSFLFHSTGFF